MSQDLIEAVARALFNAMCAESGRSVMWTDDPSWPPSKEREHARIGARAALAAIEAQGFVVVPAEPTYEMLAEADSAIPRFAPDIETGVRLMGVDGAQQCWDAMLSARPKVTP